LRSRGTSCLRNESNSARTAERNSSRRAANVGGGPGLAAASSPSTEHVSTTLRPSAAPRTDPVGGTTAAVRAQAGERDRGRSGVRKPARRPPTAHPGKSHSGLGGGLQRLPPAGLDVAGTRQAAPQELGQRARRALRLVLDRHARRIPRSTDTPPVSRSCVRARWGAVPTALPRGRGWCGADHSAEWVARPKRNEPLTSLPGARSSRGRYWDRTSDLFGVN